MKTDERLKPCPFCGKVPTIHVCDDEGNIKDYDAEYEKNPWSGLSYSICHEANSDDKHICPIATHENEITGTQLYDSIDELVEAWDKRVGGKVRMWIARDNGEYIDDVKQVGDIHLFYDTPMKVKDEKTGRWIFSCSRMICKLPSYMYPWIEDGHCYELSDIKEYIAQYSK